MVWESQMSESIDEPSVFFWFGRLRCPKVLKNNWFSCGLGASDVQKYRKTSGFLVVWEAQMSESMEKTFGFIVAPEAQMSERTEKP